MAYTTVVLIRYCMLALALREENDDRTIGDLFYQYADKVRQRIFFETMKVLITLLADFISQKFVLQHKMGKEALDEFISGLAYSVFNP